jgi:hypothetical protein
LELAEALPTTVARRIPLDSAVVASAILALAAAPVLFVFWPGIIHFDTSQVIAFAHRNVAVDWWTGIGTLILHAWFWLGLGIPLIWVGIVAANVLGIFGCLRLVLRRVPAACATLAFVVFPPIYGQLAALSRDSAYVGFSLLAFAALAKIVRTGGERRRTLLLFAFASAIIAAIGRQNGVTVVGAVTLFAMLHGRSVNWRRILAAVLAVAVALLGAYEGIRIAGAAMGVRDVDPERATFVYDLAAISVATGHDLFPQHQLRALPPGGYAPTTTSEAWLRQRFRTWNVTSLRSSKQWARRNVGNVRLASAETKILQKAWIRAIEHHPVAYLAERGRLYGALLGLSGEPRTRPTGFYFGYQGIETSTNIGHPLAFPNSYETATSVLGFFIGNHAKLPLDRPWVYLVLILGAVGYLRRRRSGGLVIASMCVAIGLNQLVFFFAGMSAAFRYEFLCVPVALLCFAYGLVAILRERFPCKPAWNIG